MLCAYILVTNYCTIHFISVTQFLVVFILLKIVFTFLQSINYTREWKIKNNIPLASQFVHVCEEKKKSVLVCRGN